MIEARIDLEAVRGGQGLPACGNCKGGLALRPVGLRIRESELNRWVKDETLDFLFLQTTDVHHDVLFNFACVLSSLCTL